MKSRFFVFHRLDFFPGFIEKDMVVNPEPCARRVGGAEIWTAKHHVKANCGKEMLQAAPV